ncbi:hypothetical protein FQR65_LT11975 [Abscondita terminalis]|nr:hypothetical protein FQR65_LT11975 [Abscondita terminalis]
MTRASSYPPPGDAPDGNHQTATIATLAKVVFWNRLDPISMENKKGTFVNTTNNSTTESTINEAIPKHIHQHNTPPQHLRLLQYGLKLSNHQHSQLNHQHQSPSIAPQLHHHHRPQSPYQSRESITPNKYQNQIFHHQPYQYQQTQENHFHYQNNQSDLLHSHNYHQLHIENPQVCIPQQQLPAHYHPQHQPKSEQQTSQNSTSTSPSLKPKDNERKKLTSNQNTRFPTAKRPSEAPVTIQGWLHKQGSDGLMLWKKRWFVLSEYCLYYYKGPDEDKILGSVLLPSYKVSICGQDDKINRKYAFKCEHVNMRTYVLAADSQELMMQWVRVLNLASLLQNSNSSDSDFQPQISSSLETTSVKPVVVNPRNTPTHVHTPSNATDLSNPSQQELNQFAQPLYANAPPKPRRLTDGYVSPSSELMERFSGETKYITLQQAQQFNLQPVYIPLTSAISKSPINIYSNPQIYPEYVCRSTPHQINTKHLHIPVNPNDVRDNHNVERRTPDTYGRSKLNRSKVIYPSDYEDIYTDQTKYKRPLSPMAYSNQSNRLNSSGPTKPYTSISIHGFKPNPSYPSQHKLPNTIPRPHSADFLEYEIKHENPTTVTRKTRPKSSLDINRHTNNDNYFYSEERYAEKMRKSAQYLPKMTQLPGHNQHTSDQQKWGYATNKADLDNTFPFTRPPVHFNEVNHNQEFFQRDLQPVRSRSVLSDGSLSKEVDMESHSTARSPFDKDPSFVNHQDLYNEEVRKSREFEQFTRSASARLTQDNNQIDEKILNREGERKREESMKRLLEWKQRMLQSPLNRKVNQGGNKHGGKHAPYYRTTENGYPVSSSDIYSQNKDVGPVTQYNSYSSDDEEIEDGCKENVQTQAGRTTDTYSSISQPHISALKASTTVSLNDSNICTTYTESGTKVLEESVLKRTPNVDETEILQNPRLNDLTKPANVTEISTNGTLVKRILAEFEQKDIDKNNLEENYMTMTSKKSVLDPSDTSSTMSVALCSDLEENLYVEMTQGSHMSILKPPEMNELQAYELVCFGENKDEPVYMELNHLGLKKNTESGFKSDLPDILIASQKKIKNDNKSESSDVDDEASKYLDSLDTLYNPRFSLSDSFRPASYYLGASRTMPELQDSSDSELVSPPPIPTSPPPMDDLDNVDESPNVSITSKELKDDLLRHKASNKEHDSERRTHASRTLDYERMLKRRPVFEEFYCEFSSSVNSVNQLLDLDNLDMTDAPISYGEHTHDYENMYISSPLSKSTKNSSSIETLSPITLHSHSRDNSRDTASSQITSSSQRSAFSSNDFVLRGRPNSSTSILDEAGEYVCGSSRYLTPVVCPENSASASEINANSLYFFESKSKQFTSFNNQSAPYYYSDLSINTSRTDSSSSILTLNNQRSAMAGSKRDITHIVNPIRSNNYIGKLAPTPHQNLFATRCKLAAEARSASVDFLNIADKCGNIDKKNIYESDTLKRLKITDSSVSLQDKSDVRNMYFGARTEKFDGVDLTIRRSYSLEGLLENVLNENVLVPREFRDAEQHEMVDAIDEQDANNTGEGSHLWEEDSIWHEQLRSASQRHTRSLDDLESIREFEKKPKKHSRGISRLVTYVNDNMFNMPIQNKHTMELEVKKDDSSKNGIFIIDREKLRQWDFLSSAPSDSQLFTQSPIHGCTNTVVDLGAGVSVGEASERNGIRDPASGSISITTRDTFPRTVTGKKVWVSNVRPVQSKSTTNLNVEYSSGPRSQQGFPPTPSHYDISSDTSQSSNSRRVNWKLGDKMNAGELLGRTHEELVLLLIQLRRQSANNCNAIEACYNEIDNIQSRLPKMDASKRLENLQKLEQIKQHLLELEKQYEKGKPLVNLVDNMVKLGSLYRFPKDNNNHPYMKDRLVFNQHIQERRLLAEERRDWNRLSPTQSELQTKVQQLYQLDQLIQEESETLQSLQQDKEEIEKTLGGLRHRLIKGFKDPVEIEQARKQQIILENELSRVHSMLAQNSRKLEETVAGNARLEQELLVLKQKLQLSKHQRSSPQISNAGDSLPCVIGTSAMLESDLHRVQQKVGNLQRQRQELSAQVKQLTDRSNSLQQLRLSSISTHLAQGNKKKLNPLWRETDLDTMTFVDHGESSDSATQSSSTMPLYINTNIKQNVESDFSTSSFKSNDSTSDDNQSQNVAPQEKQEIKTVRIVKRESERRQRDREKVSTGRWDMVAEEEDLSQNSGAIFRPNSIQKTQSSATLETTSTSNVDCERYSTGGLSRQSSLSHPSLPQAYSDVKTAVNVSTDKLSELSPIFKSESAKQIIMEMTTQEVPKHSNRRMVPKEKRRHHTAPHNNLIMKSLNQLPTDNKDFEKLDVRRARDDLDMERALRQRIDAPDVVRSTLSNKELKYNESTIDNILGTPNKIVIPERYVPEQLPQLTAEEQQYRLRKVESIKKMLSDTTIISGSSPNLASDETNTENSVSSGSSKTNSKIIEEKKQREHLLQLNQILAKQVMEMSKIVAVKALATLPLESGQLSSEEDLSPDTPLPIYQQRDNFYS